MSPVELPSAISIHLGPEMLQSLSPILLECGGGGCIVPVAGTPRTCQASTNASRTGGRGLGLLLGILKSQGAFDNSILGKEDVSSTANVAWHPQRGIRTPHSPSTCGFGRPLIGAWKRAVRQSDGTGQTFPYLYTGRLLELHRLSETRNRWPQSTPFRHIPSSSALSARLSAAIGLLHKAELSEVQATNSSTEGSFANG